MDKVINLKDRRSNTKELSAKVDILYRDVDGIRDQFIWHAMEELHLSHSQAIFWYRAAAERNYVPLYKKIGPLTLEPQTSVFTARIQGFIVGVLVCVIAYTFF